MESDPIGTPGLARNEFEAIHAFTAVMWRKLIANAHKGGWKNNLAEELLERLHEEVEELERAIMEDDNPQNIAKECADVANFCMMIADVVGGLPYERPA